MFFNVQKLLVVRFGLMLTLLVGIGAIPLQNAHAVEQLTAPELGSSAQTQVETALFVKDINPGALSSGAGSFENVDGILYFGAYEGTYGSELWKSDGTEAGTALVKDINPGTSSSSLRYPENVGGILYFSAEDGVHGHELWKSNGTEAGTVLVKDINPNTNSSSPNFLTDVNGTLYFAAYDPVYGTELWKSDGTAGGTVLVRDINPGSESSSPENLLNVNGTLYFSANDGDENHSTELWKSDGTSDGTLIVKDIFPGIVGGRPYNLIDINGTLYFVARGDLNGYNDDELWKSDGTAAGTVLVKDIQPGASPSYPDDMVNLNGTLYFCAFDGIHGHELWKSDGTASGTVMVKDILPGDRGATGDLIVFDNAVYLMANDATNGAELWKSDGTTAGTVLLKDIVPGEGSSMPESFAISNGILYFVAEDITGKELWKSDGTTAGTIYIRDINPTGGSGPDDLTDVDGTLFFSANDGVNGYELWKIGLGDPSPRTFTISGNVGVAGATLSYFDGVDKTVVSDTNGDYLISITAYSWSGTVTPSKPNYRFSPLTMSYSYLMNSVSNQNYGAEHVFIISGNAGVEEASISYTDGTVKYVTADSNGDYSLQVSDNWTGTITPYKFHYRFTPSNRSFSNVQTDQPGQDFTARRFVFIYGSVGISNVTLSYYIDETLKTVTSGSTGNYWIEVPDNWFGTITPSRTGFVFAPSSREYSNVTADQSSQDYTWTPFVTNVNDSGAGSLRQAIANATASAGMTISFDPALAGQTITLASEIQIAKNLTIDGSGLTPPVSISGNQAARIFSVATNRTVNLNSLILKDGRMSGTNYQAFGGAIYTNEFTVLTMTDVALHGNQAYQAGAVYIAPNAKVTILDSELTSNSSSSLGGAIYAQSLGKLTLKNSLLQSNEATDTGGAIYLVAAGIHLLENNTFSDNNAATAGAIMIDQTRNSNVTIRNNLFAENMSTSSVNGGGALRISMSSIPAVLQVENNTFYANQAANIGGAVWLDGGTATFTNNTFSNNRADQSGGNAGASLYMAPAGTTYLYNNILANNTEGGECASSGTPNVIGTNNLVEDRSAPCASLPETIVLDPFLGMLSENGGPALTMHLLSLSPAIDAGTNTGCPATDQRGVTRPQGEHCDIGAYEARFWVVTNTSDSGSGSLRQAIADAASGGTITFDPSLVGQTINLLSPVTITDKKIILDGSGLSPQVTINGGGTAGFNLNLSSSMDIYDLTISNFSSTLRLRMDATIRNSTLRGFTNDVIFSYESLTITDSVLENNDGQTIAAYGPVTITNSVLQNNAAEAIYVSGTSELTITDSVVSGNSGDAIRAGGPVTVINSTVMGNNGRGILVNGGSLSLVNSTIYQNAEEALMFNGADGVTIVNSTITHNQGTTGQIFVNGPGDIDISNSIIVGTTNRVFFTNAGTLNLYNSRLVCTHDDECFLSVAGTVNWFDSSVFPNATWEELGLGEPADNGGPTPTMALSPSSYLIDEGDDTICASSPVNNLDQRGVTRPQGEHCDIGAYEYDGPPVTATTTTITTSPNPSEPGQVVVATATVSPNNATGTVNVSVNDIVVCTITLVEGTGSCNMMFFGTALVEAAYIPNEPGFLGSSGSTTHEVGLASTITTITDTPDPSAQAEAVTIHVLVSNVYGDISIPTGTVEVTTAAGNCIVTLDTLGQGSCTVTYSSLGVTTISAAYSGDAQHLPSNDTDSHEVLDTTPPTVLSIVRVDGDPTSAASVDFTVTFSEPVIGVDTTVPNNSDFTLSTSGVINTAITEVSGSGTTWTVTVNTGSGNGTIRLDLSGAATITDLAGNALGNLPFTGGQTYTIEKPPVVPGKATLTSPNGSLTDTTPDFSWSEVSGATWYYLWVSNSSGTPMYKIWYTPTQANCSGGTCSVTPTTALGAGGYRWWVQTYNSAGYGPWSDGLNFTITPPALPGKTTLSAPNGSLTDTTPDFSWSEVSAATYYYLWVSNSAGTPMYKIWYTPTQANCSGGTCSVTPSTALGAGDYRWWVQTYNNAGYGPWSDGLNFTITPPALPGKTTLSAPNGSITDTTPDFSWSEVSGATWYYLWVSNSAGTPMYKIWYTPTQANCSGGTCSVTPSTALGAGGYRWWVQTYNSAGYGPWSDGLNFIIP